MRGFEREREARGGGRRWGGRLKRVTSCGVVLLGEVLLRFV